MLRLVLERFLTGEEPATVLPPARAVRARLLDMQLPVLSGEVCCCWLLLVLLLPLGSWVQKCVSVCLLLVLLFSCFQQLGMHEPDQLLKKEGLRSRQQRNA